MADHNLCLSLKRLAQCKAARVPSTFFGTALDTTSGKPASQIYDGTKANVTVPGLDPQLDEVQAGLELEPQNWPVAISHKGFPIAILRRGETYRQTTIFSFSKEAPDEL